MTLERPTISLDKRSSQLAAAVATGTTGIKTSLVGRYPLCSYDCGCDLRNGNEAACASTVMDIEFATQEASDVGHLDQEP